MYSNRFVATAALCLGLLTMAAPASAMRCEGGLVDTGDLAIEVLEACGEPDFVDRWRGVGLTPIIPNIEQWTYNFGPSQLLYVLRFQRGRLQTIDSRGYGFRTAGRQNCEPAAIEAGMSKYELLSDCGPPAQRHARFLFSSRHDLGARDVYTPRSLTPVYRETWIYNFGAARLLREVTLENGRVVAVDTAGRGFD